MICHTEATYPNSDPLHVSLSSLIVIAHRRRSPSSSLVVVVGRLLPPLFPSTGHLTCTTHARTHISKGARLKNHCLNNLCSTDRPTDGAPDHCRRTRAGGRSRTEPGLLVKLEYELGNVDESVKCVKSFFRDGVIWRAGERASVCPACLRLFPRVPLASIFRRVIPGHTRWLNIMSPTNLAELVP